MESKLSNARKPVRQLRKLLKSLPGDPSISAIHALRARSRRVEAIAGILIPADDKFRRHLLKLLKPLRKAAGAVRDMDVLAVKARTLANRQHSSSAACLIEHLQATRLESAHKLVATINKQQKCTRDSLKQLSKQIGKRSRRKESGPAAKTSSLNPYTNVAISLMDELSHWPAFTKENLHAFRIKAKKLRYVLRLAGAADLKFMNALEKAITQIGNWHDWQELGTIATEVLSPKKNRPVLHEIDEIVSRKLKLALASAHAVKARYLGAYRGLTLLEP
jgi:CHAD domain-containing protein